MATKTSALALVPDAADWPSIQRIRRVHNARQFYVWPPHINLFYPFLPEEEFERVVPRLAAIIGGLGPLKLRLSQLGDFGTTAFLAPESNADLAKLHDACALALPELPRLRRGFHPHLTLGDFNSSAECRSFLDSCPRINIKVTIDGVSLLARNSMRDAFRVPLRIRFGGGVEVGSPEPFNPDVVPGIFSRVEIDVPQRPCPRVWGNVQFSDAMEVLTEVETTDTLKCGGQNVASEFVTFNEGNLVEVTETFQSNCKNSVELSKGQQGKIIKIDKDGDALIDFFDHPKRQWVKRKNFAKLEDLSNPPLPVGGKCAQSLKSQQGGA